MKYGLADRNLSLEFDERCARVRVRKKPLEFDPFRAGLLHRAGRVSGLGRTFSFSTAVDRVFFISKYSKRRVCEQTNPSPTRTVVPRADRFESDQFAL